MVCDIEPWYSTLHQSVEINLDAQTRIRQCKRHIRSDCHMINIWARTHIIKRLVADVCYV